MPPRESQPPLGRRLLCFALVCSFGCAQLTWGPQRLSKTDDILNHKRIDELLKQAYSTGYAESQSHELLPAIIAEIQSYRQKVDENPALALAVSLAEYNFAWFREDEPARISSYNFEMDVESVNDAANLMHLSISFSGCGRADLSAQDFQRRLCNVRWPYLVMMFAELGREFAARYLMDLAASALEKAIAAFDEMKQLPHYSVYPHWYGPYDINFNDEWFPGLQPGQPVWDPGMIPIAQLLSHQANVQLIAGELGPLVQEGDADALHFEDRLSDGFDASPQGGRRAVEFMTVDPEAPDRWATRACQQAPQTCKLLRNRPELMGCLHSSVSLIRLKATAKLKPQLVAAPRLQAALVLRGDPGAGFSVGNQTLEFRTGEVYVIDDTYIRQEWHNGVRGENYVLQVAFCHPCLDSQRELYQGADEVCPGQRMALPSAPSGASEAGASPSASVISVPFAAAALWAASLPELAACHSGVSAQCSPDTQVGGANVLSALNTLSYALNNLKAAMKFSGEHVDPALSTAINQVLEGIKGFLHQPALEFFGPIMDSFLQIFEAMAPWLARQGPFQVPVPLPPSALVRIPADGSATVSSVAFPMAGGMHMPAVGFGTGMLVGNACYDATRYALSIGIRHIDTAEAYRNEEEIGRAIQDSGIPRGDIFLTTKVTSVALGMAEPHVLETVLAQQLQQLRTDYVDVYMLHAAGVKGEQLQQVWREMERMHSLGRARALGVSNHGVAELEELWRFATIKPAYLQNIFKVYKPGEQILGNAKLSLRRWTLENGLAMVGYSVINTWPHLLPPLQDPHVVAVAQAHGKTTSQVLHRWALQHGIAVIPKASSQARILENSQLFDFELSLVEMAWLDGLATLSESTHDEVRPLWGSDIFGLRAVLHESS